MDDFTSKHLDKWIATKIRLVAQDRVRELMVAAYNTDQEYWAQHGWSELCTAVGGWSQ